MKKDNTFSQGHNKDAFYLNLFIYQEIQKKYTYIQEAKQRDAVICTTNYTSGTTS